MRNRSSGASGMLYGVRDTGSKGGRISVVGLIGRILEEIPDSLLTGHPSQRLPNHASFVFKGVDGNALLIQLDMAGFACSSGSACKTGNPEPSEVLTAIGLDREWALGSLRLTLGTQTSTAEIEAFIEKLPQLILRLRN